MFCHQKGFIWEKRGLQASACRRGKPWTLRPACQDGGKETKGKELEPDGFIINGVLSSHVRSRSRDRAQPGSPPIRPGSAHRLSHWLFSGRVRPTLSVGKGVRASAWVCACVSSCSVLERTWPQYLQPRHCGVGTHTFLLFPSFPRTSAVFPQLSLGVNSRVNVFSCLRGHLGCCVLSLLWPD